jgi:arsenite methyltransferase
LALTTNIDGHWKLFYDIFDATLNELNEPEYCLQLDAQQRHRGNIDALTKLFSAAGFTVIQTLEDSMEMKFRNGTAFLNHHFVKLGWLGSWLDIFPAEKRQDIFSALENNLNDYAEAQGGLDLVVPMVYMEGQKG